MQFNAIPEKELRNRMAALARYLEDYDLPADLGGARPDCDVVDGAIRYIKHKRAELDQTLEWLAEKQKKINDLRQGKASGPSAFQSAGEMVREALEGGSNERALAAAVYAVAVAVKRISDTLERITGQTELERLRDEVEFLKDQAGARFRKEGT